MGFVNGALADTKGTTRSYRSPQGDEGGAEILRIPRHATPSRYFTKPLTGLGQEQSHVAAQARDNPNPT